LTQLAAWGKGWGVARKLGVQYPGAIYHLMNRGDRREPIFKDDADRARFLETLGQCCTKTEWQVHAGCLRNNHFHLVIETPKANLVAGMKWFLGTYTARFNRRHKLFGHLFSGRYKALLVDGSGDGYLNSKGTVGADGRPGRGETLRGGTAGERRGEGPADRGGGIEAVELTESELRRRRKGDPKKVRIAGRLREKTTMTLKWITGEMYMGAWTRVSNLLSQARRGQK